MRSIQFGRRAVYAESGAIISAISQKRVSLGGYIHTAYYKRGARLGWAADLETTHFQRHPAEELRRTPASWRNNKKRESERIL
jgi:hypothetical protein